MTIALYCPPNLTCIAFAIVSATYGKLGQENYCVDVSDTCRDLIKQQGGRLSLAAGSKKKYFPDPARGKKKKFHLVRDCVSVWASLAKCM